MKFTRLICIFCFVFLLGCSSDDEMPEPMVQSTVFQGRILYSDNNEPITNALFKIIAYESSLFSGDTIVDTFDLMFNSNSQGEFNTIFDANPDIDYFFVLVDFFDDENSGLIIGGADFANGMVCNPVACDAFLPGSEYTGLTISVPRP